MTEEQSASEPEDRRELNTRALLERVQAAKQSVSDEDRPDQVEKQHAAGKLTARERLEYLFDGGQFVEFGQLASPHPATPEIYNWDREDAPADGVITAVGEVDGRPVGVGAMDFTVKGGSLGHTGAYKIRRIAELSCRRGFPFVLLHDSGGHRIQEGLDARPYAYGDPTGPTGIFTIQAQLSGWVPQVSAMMGPGFAASTNYAALCDFIPMVKGTSTMGVAGPALVKAALGIDLSKEEIGGAEFQTVETGMADRMYEDDRSCLDAIREFLSYFPSNANERPPTSNNYDPPYDESVERILDVIPENTKKAYDVYKIIDGIIDQNSFFELKPDYARNIVTGFARLEGEPTGLLATNPRIMSGTFDVPACDKASHFISLCDSFDIPLVFLMDAPGVLPGPDSERQGIARHSGKVLFEVNRATVPKLSVVMRRGYGFGYVLMAGGRSTQNDLTVVWPTAEIAAMGIEGAVDIAYRREIEAADDPEQKREELIQKFINRTGAIRAVEHFGVDAAIDPRDTREWLVQALAYSRSKYSKGWPPKKHSVNPI